MLHNINTAAFHVGFALCRAPFPSFEGCGNEPHGDLLLRFTFCGWSRNNSFAPCAFFSTFFTLFRGGKDIPFRVRIFVAHLIKSTLMMTFRHLQASLTLHLLLKVCTRPILTASTLYPMKRMHTFTESRRCCSRPSSPYRAKRRPTQRIRPRLHIFRR